MAKLEKKKNKKKLDYFDAFSDQIALARQEAQLLQEVTENFTTADALVGYIEKAHVIENKADEICVNVYDAILPDFVTPIDREDILELVNSLDDLTDKIEEVIQTFYMYDIHFMADGAKTFARIAVQCCEGLESALKDFRDFKKAHKKLQASFNTITQLEDEADALYMEVNRSLYTDDRENPMRVLVWSRIYNIMEDCIDLCEAIGELMHAIVLKHA